MNLNDLDKVARFKAEINRLYQEINREKNIPILKAEKELKALYEAMSIAKKALVKSKEDFAKFKESEVYKNYVQAKLHFETSEFYDELSSTSLLAIILPTDDEGLRQRQQMRDREKILIYVMAMIRSQCMPDTYPESWLGEQQMQMQYNNESV